MDTLHHNWTLLPGVKEVTFVYSIGCSTVHRVAGNFKAQR